MNTKKHNIPLSNARLNRIIKESIEHVLNEDPMLDAKNAAFHDMSMANKKVRDANKKIAQDNKIARIVDDAWEDNTRNGRDKHHFSMDLDRRVPRASTQGFLQDTASMKDRREEVARMIRGEEPSPSINPYEYEPYELNALPQSWGDIDATIGDDIDAFNEFNDDDNYFPIYRK